MISQCNSYEKQKKIDIAIQTWKNNGCFDNPNLFSETKQTIFELQSGVISVGIFNYEWKVVLLCFLTCICPSQCTLSQVFETFSNNYNKYLQNISNDDISQLSKIDLHFALIKLYSTYEKITITPTLLKTEVTAIKSLLSDIARTNSFNYMISENPDNHLQFIIINAIITKNSINELVYDNEEISIHLK